MCVIGRQAESYDKALEQRVSELESKLAQLLEEKTS